jgi:hypothetical protein
MGEDRSGRGETGEERGERGDGIARRVSAQGLEKLDKRERREIFRGVS